MLKDNRVPIIEALEQHQQRSQSNFHVPGHKQGNAVPSFSWLQEIAKYDLTEVGELDDLHQPEGVIAEAQSLASKAFGAQKTWFLVGGTTAGILAAVLSVCKPGEKILIARNSHQAVYHGCYLAGAEAVCMETRFDPITQKELPYTADLVDQYLRTYSDIQAVFLTSPNYYGRILPISEIATRCHQANVPLLVDEAHGAHFAFHPFLPASALSSGADLVVQSTHKMLPSFTMSSMLHIQGSLLDEEAISEALRMVESSSPSYPLLASLDLARQIMEQQGEKLLDKKMGELNDFRVYLRNLKYITELHSPNQDPFKIYLSANKSVTGFHIAEWLEKKGIYTELADAFGVLAVASIGSKKADFLLLQQALDELDQEISTWAAEEIPRFPDSRISSHSISYESIRKKEVVWLPITDVVGKFAAKSIIPYPPGVPTILPGEVYTESKLAWLQKLVQAGAKIRGIRLSSSLFVSVLQ